ncbi:MAG: SRPBCC domain-containing protein [Deltaproteobacteria bacterium]|nr:SRPBCC domain-containing protein [Deltaproteobacteria bacterium]
MKPVKHGIKVFRFLGVRREKVFEAWTKPALMKKWYCPEECRILKDGPARSGTYRSC